MRLLSMALAAALSFIALPASADVSQTTPTSFVLTHEADVPVSVDRAYRALTQVGRWWSGAHTYSRDSRNLSIDPRAGGCWCERWNGGSVEHMRVLMNIERDGVRTVRFAGGLGPLQEMGVTGIMTFTITPLASGAKVSINYRVTGDTGLHLDQIAAPVDGVLSEQFARLIRYTSTGAPE